MTKSIKSMAALTAAILLSACGAPIPPTPENMEGKTLEEKIAILEKSGDLPKLDRSDDLLGPDVDGNGVRDDIDAYIAAQPLTQPQKNALTQAAYSVQKTLLINLRSQQELNASGKRISRAAKCVSDRIPGHRHFSTVPRYTKKIESITVNTKKRTMRYIDYHKARAGAIISIPEGDTCNDTK